MRVALVVDEPFSEGGKRGWERVRAREGVRSERDGREDVSKGVRVEEGRLWKGGRQSEDGPSKSHASGD